MAAVGQTNRPSAAAQTAIADLFRFDILLAGKESTVKPVRPKATRENQRNLPATVLAAMEQRPEPAPSALPKTLSCTRPSVLIAPPAIPAGPWRMKLGANLARLEHTREGLKALLATLPDLIAVDRTSTQIEVQKACEEIGSLRSEQAIHVPQPPEPPSAVPERWPELGTQLMP